MKPPRESQIGHLDVMDVVDVVDLVDVVNCSLVGALFFSGVLQPSPSPSPSLLASLFLFLPSPLFSSLFFFGE